MFLSWSSLALISSISNLSLYTYGSLACMSKWLDYHPRTLWQRACVPEQCIPHPLNSAAIILTPDLHHHGLQLCCDHLAQGAGVMTTLSFWPGTASTAKVYHQVRIVLELFVWSDTDHRDGMIRRIMREFAMFLNSMMQFLLVLSVSFTKLIKTLGDHSLEL